MTTDAHAWITALRHSHDDLARLVSDLDGTQLRAQSYCDDWNIGQALSHLGSQADIFQLILDATLAGTDIPGQDAFPPIWDKWNAKSPEQQAVDSITANEAWLQALEGLSDEALDALHLQMFGMDLDASGLVRMRLGEFVVHSWDIAVSFDEAAQLNAEGVNLLIDSLGQVVARSGKPQGKKFGLEVDLSNPARTYALEVGDGVTLSDPDQQSVDDSIALPAEAFYRLVYGRLDPEHTPASVNEESGTHLDDLRAVFPGF